MQIRRAVAFALLFATSVLAQDTDEVARRKWLERLLKAQAAPPAPALTESPGVTAADVAFDSATLGRQMHYRVLLPAGYAQSHRHYPVLYLFHGYLNPYYEWDRQTRLAEHLQRYNLIVVLVQGDNAFYMDSAVPGSRDLYQTYVNREVMPHVESHYRVISETHGRAIGGVSMGGYGAVLHALRRPGAFVFAADFAGAVNFAADTELQGYLSAFDARSLGAAGSEERTARDVMQLVAKADPQLMPYFYIVCGNDDELLAQNLTFAEALRKQKIRNEVRLTPGGHEWIVWDEAIADMLETMARLIPAMRKT